MTLDIIVPPTPFVFKGAKELHFGISIQYLSSIPILQQQHIERKTGWNSKERIYR
jgi:hypothetical protein